MVILQHIIRTNKPEFLSQSGYNELFYFRDHGCCVFCGKDLSGTIHVTESREIHYDHIIPLTNHGINDISNLQLSCQECNLKKRDESMTSVKYQQWYEIDEVNEIET